MGDKKSELDGSPMGTIDDNRKAAADDDDDDEKEKKERGVCTPFTIIFSLSLRHTTQIILPLFRFLLWPASGFSHDVEIIVSFSFTKHVNGSKGSRNLSIYIWLAESSRDLMSFCFHASSNGG